MSKKNLDPAVWMPMIQPLVDDRVVAVGLMGRRGTMRMAITHRRVRTKQDGLPNGLFFAVTATHIYLFDYKYKWGKLVPHKRITRWERDHVHIDADQSSMFDVLAFTFADGTRLEFESARGYDCNHAFFRELLQGSRK